VTLNRYYSRSTNLANVNYVLTDLDWTQHLYSFALFPIFAIPLAISSSVNPPLYHFFNYSLPMLFSVPGIFFLVSLFKPRLNFWVSSDPPGTPLKPGVFYLFEDIGAVDFRHGKAFRRQLHARSVFPLNIIGLSRIKLIITVHLAGTRPRLFIEISCGGKPSSGLMAPSSTSRHQLQ
jgi:hypothetical protein